MGELESYKKPSDFERKGPFSHHILLDHDYLMKMINVVKPGLINDINKNQPSYYVYHIVLKVSNNLSLFNEWVIWIGQCNHFG